MSRQTNYDSTTGNRWQVNADQSGPAFKDEGGVAAFRNDADDGYVRVRGLPMVADGDVEVSRDGNDDVDRVTVWKLGSGRTIKLQETTITRDGNGDVDQTVTNHYDDAGALLSGLTETVGLTRTGGDVTDLDDGWA